MVNTSYGYVAKDTNSTEKIYITPKPNSEMAKDICVGLIPICAGIGYIVYSAFHHGAHAHDLAEYEALKKLNVIH